MAAKLTKTSTPGIFRRHAKTCSGRNKCDCSWVVVSRYKGKQHKTACRTKGDAVKLQAEQRTGEAKPSPAIKFEPFFEGWIKTYSGRTARGFSETSREEYDRSIRNHAVPEWGTWKLDDIDAPDVRSLFVKMRDDDATTSEIKKLRSSLSALFATAVEDGVLRSSPAQGIRIPAAPETEDEDEQEAKAMTREELGILLAALPEQHQLFFEFLAHTGLRIGEAAGLTWEHVDLGDKPKLRVREQVYRGKRKRLKTKGSRRDIPLSPQMAKRLLTHRAGNYQAGASPVFPSPGKLRRTEAGLPFPLSSQNFARDVLHPSREAVGMDWVTFHTFRHTCASLLFEAGRNVKQVQEWLGHSDPSFTLRRYVHLMDGGVGDAAFLDDKVVPAGATQRQQERPEKPQKDETPSTPEAAA